MGKIDLRKDMEQLNFPKYELTIRQYKHQHWIFDMIRKKEVVLTPEEWVRQHLIHHLIFDLGYPRSLVKVESGLQVNQLKKRSDVVVFDRAAKALLLAECKSWKVPVNQKAFDQIFIYNKEIKAPYLLITNGLNHFCCEVGPGGEAHFLNEIPSFPS